MGRTSDFAFAVAKFDSGGRNMKGRIWFGYEMGRHPRFKKLRDHEGFRGNKKCGCLFQLKD